jgi:hypothetical protein
LPDWSEKQMLQISSLREMTWKLRHGRFSIWDGKHDIARKLCRSPAIGSRAISSSYHFGQPDVHAFASLFIDHGSSKDRYFLNTDLIQLTSGLLRRTYEYFEESLLGCDVLAMYHAKR